MNGQINVNALRSIIESTVADMVEGTHEVDVTKISDTLTNLSRRLNSVAWADISSVAIDVVTRDAMESGPLDASHWHTIKNIKEVRTLTGSGLKEAKDAVQWAMPVVLRNIAATALDNLANENTKHGYAVQEHVSAVRHIAALTDIDSAYNADHTPF